MQTIGCLHCKEFFDIRGDIYYLTLECPNCLRNLFIIHCNKDYAFKGLRREINFTHDGLNNVYKYCDICDEWCFWECRSSYDEVIQEFYCSKNHLIHYTNNQVNDGRGYNYNKYRANLIGKSLSFTNGINTLINSFFLILDTFFICLFFARIFNFSIP
jgi:hypothetical protein